MEKNSKTVRRSWSDAASLRPTFKGFTISSVPQNGVNGVEKEAVTSSSTSRPSTPTQTSPTTKTAATSTSNLPTDFHNGGLQKVVDASKEAVTLIVPTIELPVFGTLQSRCEYLKVFCCSIFAKLQISTLKHLVA